MYKLIFSLVIVGRNLKSVLYFFYFFLILLKFYFGAIMSVWIDRLVSYYAVDRQIDITHLPVVFIIEIITYHPFWFLSEMNLCTIFEIPKLENFQTFYRCFQKFRFQMHSFMHSSLKKILLKKKIKLLKIYDYVTDFNGLHYKSIRII